MNQQFFEIIDLIKKSRSSVIQIVNSKLIDLYWAVGEYISGQISKKKWGESVVEELAEYIHSSEPDIKGFSNKNLWRMKQFYETYQNFPKLSALLREISMKYRFRLQRLSNHEQPN